MELRWNKLGTAARLFLGLAALALLVAAWWLLRDDKRGLEVQRDRLLELRRPGAWANVVRTPKGIASPYGEVSGVASSRRHGDVAWAIRDSGNPATLYALSPTSHPGRFRVSEFPVRGVRNRDWEDLVYGEDSHGPYLLIVDTGAKTIHRVPEPDPAVPGEVRVTESYRYRFPDRGSRSCGPSDNVEAAFLYPAQGGQLHLVRKEKRPARVYRFEALFAARTNVPVRIGTLPDSCISVAALTPDSSQMVTASHATLRVRQATDDLPSLLAARPLLTARISPDNNEGGDFYPFGSDEILVGAENRSTWRFRHEDR